MKISRIFKPQSGAASFFISILVWGIGVGCFSATMNNFLHDIYEMNSVDRGFLEFFRELPGLCLVLLFAILHKTSNWKILRLGTMVSMIGVALLMVPANKICATGFIMIWSLGEHLIMPCRQAIAMQVAKPEHAGQSLGLLTSASYFGHVTGSIIVALIFYLGATQWHFSEHCLFNIVWGLVALLMCISTVSTFTKDAPDQITKRPQLYFNRKFNKFYALELFYGARKQVFFTFAPYVLIREYGFKTDSMALLMGICAAANIFAAPGVGKITDKVGYRNVMIWDTIILSVVCLLYGFSGQLFAPQIAVVVLCINYLLDTIISTTSLATNIYLKELASSRDELTATMSTGISINHFISIIIAPLGGLIWKHYGLGVLFSFSAIMAICNSIFAWTLPKPKFPHK